jgi:hypothetical protein
VRVAHTKGEHVWHVHDDTDEFFLVLEGVRIGNVPASVQLEQRLGDGQAEV